MLNEKEMSEIYTKRPILSRIFAKKEQKDESQSALKVNNLVKQNDIKSDSKSGIIEKLISFNENMVLPIKS